MSKYIKKTKIDKNKDGYGGAKARLYHSNDCLSVIFEFLTMKKCLRFQRLAWRFYHKIVPRRLGNESVKI